MHLYLNLTCRPESHYLSAFFDSKMDPELFAPSPCFNVPVREHTPSLNVHSDESPDSRAQTSITEQLTLVSTRPAFDMGSLDRCWLTLFNEACAVPPPEPQQLEPCDLKIDPSPDCSNVVDQSFDPTFISIASDELEDTKRVLLPPPQSSSSSPVSISCHDNPHDQCSSLCVRSNSCAQQQPSPAPSDALCPPATDDDDECCIMSVEPGTQSQSKARRPRSQRLRRPPRKLLSMSMSNAHATSSLENKPQPALPKPLAPLLSRAKYEALMSALELRCYARMLDLCRHTDGIVGIEFDESTVCDVCRQVCFRLLTNDCLHAARTIGRYLLHSKVRTAHYRH